MIDPVLRAAFEHGRRVVLERRESETQQRRAFRAYVDGESQAARNDERPARTVETQPA
jgi:hypothetical protein